MENFVPGESEMGGWKVQCLTHTDEHIKAIIFKLKLLLGSLKDAKYDSEDRIARKMRTQ
jgi:hypothetical protein